MTDIMKLIEELKVSGSSIYLSRKAATAIEALQAENERQKRQEIERLLRIETKVDELIAERDALQAKLDELQRQEPVKFLVNGARFKLANCGPSSSGFVGFPKELAGRWVALVAADDDCHLKFAAPKALEPLTDDRIGELQVKHLYVSDDGYSIRGQWEFARAIEAAHRITKGTP